MAETPTDPLIAYAIDAIGTLGVAMIVLAYFLITRRRLTGDDARYHLLNFVGAWLVMVSLWFHWNTPSVIIETFWIGISAYGLWRCRRIGRGANAQTKKRS